MPCSAGLPSCPPGGELPKRSYRDTVPRWFEPFARWQMLMRSKLDLVGIVALLVVIASACATSVSVAGGLGGAASDAAGGLGGAAGSAASGAAGAASDAAGGLGGAAGSAASGAAGAAGSAVGSSVDGIGSLGRDAAQALGNLGGGSFGPSAVFGLDPREHEPPPRRKATKTTGGSSEPIRARRMCSDILNDPAGYDQALVQLCRKVSSR